ncbi:hypothetical protein [Cupriavidus sp. CuC1]|uniref:hypothetical protein n=1 Tax=Cupriavidus sp. CuC1 TaxID=3373131 RepID=UPI0037D34230
MGPLGLALSFVALWAIYEFTSIPNSKYSTSVFIGVAASISVSIVFFAYRVGIYHRNNAVLNADLVGEDGRVCANKKPKNVTLARRDSYIQFMMSSYFYFTAQLIGLFALFKFKGQGVAFVVATSVAGFLLQLVSKSVDRANQKRAAAAAENDEEHRRARARRQRVVESILIGMALLIPLFWDVSQANLSMAKLVMEKLGLRASDATLRVTGKALQTLIDTAEINGATMSICPSGPGSALVSPVNVYWHGMGKISLLALAGEAAAEFDVPSDDVQIVRQSGLRCHQLSRTVHFASGSPRPSDESELVRIRQESSKVLGSFMAPTKETGGWVLRQVQITGHADPMPLGDAGNERLALDRARAVASELSNEPIFAERIKIDRVKPELLSDGSRFPVNISCPMTGNGKSLAECHSANRRVEARLIFAKVGRIKSE